ncbi:hypothetical protein L6452_20922 [Arctium lappa]|uniref:Uncharacterized protein n=1 Tax=Arctium lappa TaxID=4217 RepID=A0ACB9BDI8_ARCLA|nr:hypothetical protein L6452_20922 [Arctium lappa]
MKKIQPKKIKGGIITMPFIFANEIGEKLAVVGFQTNMISYLTQQLHMPMTKAANTLTNFGGTASLTPLLGAFIADSFAGRFWTITIASIIYQIGLISLTLSAVLPKLRPPPCKNGEICQEANTGQVAILYISLLLTAVGSGGIRPCVVAFGADQFDGTDEKQKTSTWKFFNWYYFSMGASMLVAVTVIVYIQDNIGWGWGLGVPSIAMTVSIVTFVIGYPLYRNLNPAGSPFTRLIQVCVAAYKKRNLPMVSDHKLLYENEELDASISVSGKLLHTKQMKFLDKAAIVTKEEYAKLQSNPNLWRLNTVHRVEELKSVIRMGPIWASGILLITAYAQQSTFSLQQAKTMNRSLTESFQIPAGSMTVFTLISMLTTIVFYDRVFVPITRKLTGLERGISFLSRMGIGLAISVLATLVAGFIEIKRKNAAFAHGLTYKPHETIPISVFWLVPQYSLHGVAETFMSIGHLEFFYDQAPESMRSTATALFWVSIAGGNYVSTLLVMMVHKLSAGRDGSNWLPDDNLNTGKLENFYWLITLLQVLNLIYYLFCAKFYTFKPIQVAHKQDGSKNDGIELGNNDEFPKLDFFRRFSGSGLDESVWFGGSGLRRRNSFIQTPSYIPRFRERQSPVATGHSAPATATSSQMFILVIISLSGFNTTAVLAVDC